MAIESHALDLLKSLADESRLKLVAILLHGRERSVEELAAILGLRAPTVSHHLARLRAVGLVAMRAEGNTHLYHLDRGALAAASRDLLSTQQLAGMVRGLEPAGWDRKVLSDFLDGERLKEIPASRKKRDVVLRWLAERFSFDRDYAEMEVNALLQRHHEDSATLRRELVGAGLMRREAGIYRRVPPA